MKRILLSFSVICLILLTGVISRAQTIELNGVYRGKNLFIQNPYLANKKSYCIQSISVNGVTVANSLNSSAVQVDLQSLMLDAPVKIIITHVAGCDPKILNGAVLEQNVGFSFIQYTVDNSSISWITIGENPGKGEFTIEKMKIDGWEPIKKVPAKGDLDNNQYSLAVAHYSGENIFRIRYVIENKDFISEEFSFYSAEDPVSYFPVDEVYDLLSLSRITDYKIKSLEGKVVMEGIAQDINVEGLPYGEYFLIIENRQETFYKPEPERIEKKRVPRKKEL